MVTDGIILNDRIDNIVATESTLNITTSTIDLEVYSYSVSSGTSAQTIRTDGTQTRARAEIASTNSILIGQQIECIRIPISKTGSPTGTAVIGTLDGSSSPVIVFGYIDVTTITTSFMAYEFCRDTPYTISLGDRIGLRLLNGTQDASNLISIGSDATNPFDGTNTFRQGYGTSWVSTTGEDMNMQLYRIEEIPNNVQVAGIGGIYSYEDNVMDISFEGPNFQIKVILIFVAVMFMVGGALTEVRKR
jgi:hypothetical protein